MTSPQFATLTSDDQVTSEAVALDLPPASLGVRLASGLIDFMATLVIGFLILLIATIAAARTDAALLWVAFIGSMITIFLIIPTTLETLTRGRTLGKLALGLRTVRDDAGPVSFQHVLVRHLIGFVEIYVFTGAPAFFAILLSGRGKRLGDYAAGTYVVRERVALRLTPPLPMPPRLESWAKGADITALPSGLALAVRQYLGRLPSIDPASRARIGANLADEVSAHVAPPPPSGTPPEEFLAAVVASRRDRDLARLRRESELRARLTSR